MTGAGWKEARETKGMTLRALAAAAGISPPFLSDVEHSRRKFSAEVERRVRAVLGLPEAIPDASPFCVVCEGPLRVVTGHVYDPSTGPPIYGPGSVGQYVESTSIWCPRCGLSYQHEPLRAPRSGPGTPEKGAKT